MATNAPRYWDPMTKPVVGSLSFNNMTMEARVFDGKSWITIPGDRIQDMSQDELYNLTHVSNNMSDKWLEARYTDLKEMREQQEEEYNTLRDKYKIFEILKISGEDDNVR